MVKTHYDKIKEKIYSRKFSSTLIENCIKNLKMNKSPDFDFLSNEFFKFGNSKLLVGTIRTLFNLMAMTGFKHKNFNISIIKPDISIVRQNVLIKNCLNINRMARTKTFFEALKIESFKAYFQGNLDKNYIF